MTHKLHKKKMNSEQAILPNPCLEEEEEEVNVVDIPKGWHHLA
jgi:hypothetical protein